MAFFFFSPSMIFYFQSSQAFSYRVFTEFSFRGPLFPGSDSIRSIICRARPLIYWFYLVLPNFTEFYRVFLVIVWCDESFFCVQSSMNIYWFGTFFVFFPSFFLVFPLPRRRSLASENRRGRRRRRRRLAGVATPPWPSQGRRPIDCVSKTKRRRRQWIPPPTNKYQKKNIPP